MFAGAEDDAIDRVLVQLQEARRGPHTNALGRVMDDLADRLSWQMQAKMALAWEAAKRFPQMRQ
ncbi:MAG: hypothetical protein Q8O15_01400 [Rectinemataceae bacterium]|nr:hypothetical protein [Rectinemataceae bacterium]